MSGNLFMFKRISWSPLRDFETQMADDGKPCIRL